VTAEVDLQFMQAALELAAGARFISHPNPNVGCVLVKDGQVVGRGATGRVGEAHAEAGALEDAGECAYGATAYVTLEPCSHYGRTPPCAQALIDAGVLRVVAAALDPNPLVSGKGLAMLTSAGIETSHGLCAEESRWLLRGFMSRMERGRPWVRAKVATSIDGRTAMANGESQWITGSAARRDGQFCRAESDCVLTGIGTILDDNPTLNVRLSPDDLSIEGKVRQPMRALMDTRARLPMACQWLREPGRKRVYSVFEKSFPDTESVCFKGAETIDCKRVLIDLAEQEVNFVHLEAGAVLLGAFLKANLVDELVVYQAPALLGSEGRPMALISGLVHISDALRWRFAEVKTVGNDLRMVLLRT